MKTALFIARRYFTAQRKEDRQQGGSSFLLFLGMLLSLFTFSRQRIERAYLRFTDAFIRQNFIRLLSNISMFGVGTGTAALVVILSVFNGLEDLTKSLYRTYNPELKISAKKGKSFEVDSAMVQSIRAIDGVVAVTEVIEDNALLKYRDNQMVVTIKGVSDNFNEQYDFKSTVYLGEPLIKKDGRNVCLVGIGVKHNMGIQLNDPTHALQLWYPKNVKGASLNPSKAFNKKYIGAGGVFAIEQQFDQNYMIAPLRFMQGLLNYGTKRTALEIKVASTEQIKAVQKKAKALLGDTYHVKTAEEQQVSILRAVEIERLFVFITFILVLGIASFNIFFSLAMLAIEKKKDIAIMKSFGASNGFIRNIFLLEGAIIAFTGSAIGLVVGFLLCLAQQEFGMVDLGVQNTVIQAYPVKILWPDFLNTAIVVVFVTLAASILPARNAAKTEIQSNL